jgi:hypothetical protein
MQQAMAAGGRPQMGGGGARGARGQATNANGRPGVVFVREPTAS